MRRYNVSRRNSHEFRYFHRVGLHSAKLLRQNLSVLPWRSKFSAFDFMATALCLLPTYRSSAETSGGSRPSSGSGSVASLEPSRIVRNNSTVVNPPQTNPANNGTKPPMNSGDV